MDGWNIQSMLFLITDYTDIFGLVDTRWGVRWGFLDSRWDKKTLAHIDKGLRNCKDSIADQLEQRH